MELANLEIWLREQLLDIPTVVGAVGAQIFNSVAARKAAFPFLIFTIIPLQDNFGQAAASIQSRFIVDITFKSDLPLPVGIDAAVAAVKAHFKGHKGATFNDSRIAIRHDRPISRIEPGATADEKILSRGGSYKAWVS